MADFTVRSDSVDVEHIMQQIRARIREKRGVDYTEEEIRELANVKLEKFLDPRSIRSDLLQHYQARRAQSPALQNYVFEDTTLYATNRRLVAWLRRMLRPADREKVDRILKEQYADTPAERRSTLLQEARKARFTRLRFLERLAHRLPLRTEAASLLVKDAKVFLRDTTQWSQLLLLVALTLVYVYNFSVLDLERIPYLSRTLKNLYAHTNLSELKRTLSHWARIEEYYRALGQN